MAEFLTTANAISEIERIIKEADKEIILITPYLKIQPNLLQTLRYMAKNKHICVIHGKKKTIDDEDTRTFLNKTENIELHYVKNLHAKCYFNENDMVITSLNLYDYSQNNKEMGVLLNRVNDEKAFEDAKQEYKVILNDDGERKVIAFTDKKESIIGRITQGFKTITSDSLSLSTGGKSTRKCKDCGKTIEFENRRPRCKECWSKMKHKARSSKKRA